MQDRFGCALDAGQHPLSIAVNGGHHRGLGFKGDAADPGVAHFERGAANTACFPGAKQSLLDWIARGGLAVGCKLGIVTENRHH